MKSHFLKKFVSFVLCSIIIVCVLMMSVYSEEVQTEDVTEENSVRSVMFDVFYSTSYRFYQWNILPKKVYVCKFDYTTSYYNTAVMNAITKWNNGLGTSLYQITSYDSSNSEFQTLESGSLKFMGGNTQDLQYTGVFDYNALDSFYTGGCARIDYSDFRTEYTASGQSVTVHTAVRGFACVTDLSDEGLPSSLSNYINIATHEMGHLLGWYGHSTVSSDVMYSSPSSVVTLSNRDIRHILQVYD